jgi:hypothetical protein
MSVVRERFAAALRAEFARTGDACLLAAAAILEPAMPGRAAIDDSAALERLAELLAARPEMRLYTLALRVARELDEPRALAGGFRRSHWTARQPSIAQRRIAGHSASSFSGRSGSRSLAGITCERRSCGPAINFLLTSLVNSSLSGDPAAGFCTCQRGLKSNSLSPRPRAIPSRSSG